MHEDSCLPHRIGKMPGEVGGGGAERRKGLHYKVKTTDVELNHTVQRC